MRWGRPTRNEREGRPTKNSRGSVKNWGGEDRLKIERRSRKNGGIRGGQKFRMGRPIRNGGRSGDLLKSRGKGD